MTNREVLRDAWVDFVENGNIGEVVRPVIARSWERSQGVNPYLNCKPRLSDSMLLARRNQYEKLLLVARPIMDEIQAAWSNILVYLADREGYILEIAGNQEFFPPGIRAREEDVGTNAIGLVLTEGRPVEVFGHEHYLYSSRIFSGAAAPIFDGSKKILGVIDIVHFLEGTPPGLLQIAKMAARAIEQELNEWETIKMSAVIDCLAYGLCITNGRGRIINVNEKFLNVLGENRRKRVIGKPLANFIENNHILEKLISKNPNERIRDFNIGTEKPVRISLRYKFILQDSDDLENTFILFTVHDNLTINHLPSRTRTDEDLIGFDYFVGKSRPWLNIMELAQRAAQFSSSVLIVGESGTGKELLAQAIHKSSARTGPFVPINCGAIPKDLLQSELFGYEEGSFTGAKKGGAPGKFEIANGGTVFLDEIGEMPLNMQVSLLRFLQDKTVTRVGGHRSKKVNVRIIAATNRDLERCIAEETFREDLYYRLNVFNILMPPLRERKEDIPLLADFILKKICIQFGRNKVSVSKDAMEILFKYDWPGNIRELRNILERAVVLLNGNEITPEILPERLHKNQTVQSLYLTEDSHNLKSYERHIIIQTLAKHQGNISRTARALGVTRGTLYRKMDQMNIKPAGK